MGRQDLAGCHCGDLPLGVVGTWWKRTGTQVCSAVRLLQVKSVKPCLKQLQQCIQTISTLHDDEILPSNPADLFHWLPKEHMCVLVYLVSPWMGQGPGAQVREKRAPVTAVI